MGILIFLSPFYRISAVMALASIMLGCTVGTDYEKPQLKLPQSWISANGEQAKAGTDKSQQEWWKNFHDPVMEQLIVKASTGNFDLQIAESRIAATRAVRANASVSLFPTGNLKGTVTREANQLPVPVNFPGIKDPFNFFQSGFDASWELDLFGGQRRQLEAASAEMQASEASRDDIMISLVAEVARTYADIRQYQEQLRIAQDTITSNSNTADIARQRFEVGSAPRFELTQAEAQLQQAQTQIPYYTNLLLQTEYSLDVLLGEQPGAAHKLVSEIKPIPVADEKPIFTAPASVIANRPDIHRAERKLAGATAQQGVAVAKFFPDISLVGFVGLLSTDAGHLLTAGSESWMAGANVIWPILSYGTLSANLDVANAQQQEAMASYRKTIISALSDVERSVTACSEQEKYRLLLEKSVEANQYADSIAHQRYHEGLTSFLEVLDSQRTLYSSQNQLAEAEAKTAQNLFAVYKSLGLGWSANPVKAEK